MSNEGGQGIVKLAAELYDIPVIGYKSFEGAVRAGVIFPRRAKGAGGIGAY